MHVLSSNLRKQLETSVLAARRAAESASRAALDTLGIFSRDKPSYLDDYQAELRNGMRAKLRQLGGDRELLVADCAYEEAVGRTFSFWQPPGIREFGEDERLQASRTAIAVEEAFLELAGGGPAARIEFTTFL